MSAEPSVVSSNNVTGSVSNSLSLHSVGPGAGNNLASHTHTTASRNLFPEYRYGREEMLSLFDRNCLLPQILPSFKKLFVDKVQYPLALTPSSEEEINSHSPLGSSVSTKDYLFVLLNSVHYFTLKGTPSLVATPDRRLWHSLTWFRARRNCGQRPNAR